MLSFSNTRPAPSADDDRLLLARTLQAEAGNQGFQGMVDVGSVLRNRVSAGGYGEGLRGVIMKPGQISALNKITGYAGGAQGQDMDFTPNDEAFRAADAILAGDYEDRTGGATHYYANIPGVSGVPSWAKGKDQTKLGDHYFLNADAGRGPSQNPAGSPLAGFAANAEANASRFEEAGLILNFANRVASAGAEEPRGDGSQFQLPGQVGFEPIIGYPELAAMSTKGRPNQVEGGATPPSAPPAEASAEEEEVKKLGLMGKIGEFLFPNAEDPENAFRDRLGALGVGLGQMSHGQPVNLQPYFAGQQQMRQSIIDQKLEAEAAQQKLAIDSLTAQTGARNAQTAAARLAHEISTDPSNVDYSSIAQAMPELEGLIGLAQSGDANAQKQIATYLGDRAAMTMSDDPQVQEAIRKFSMAPRDDVEGRLAALDGLDSDQRAEVLRIGGDIVGTPDTTPGAVKLAEHLMEADPAAYAGEGGEAKALREAARLQSGVQDGVNPELVKFHAGEASDIRKEYQQRGTTASESLQAVRLASEANNEAIANNVELSGWGNWAADKSRDLSLFGGSNAFKTFAEWAGVPVDAYGKMNEAQQIMMRSLAQSYTGQGTISDYERAAMANEVLSMDMSNHRRSEMISRIKALAMADLADSEAARQIRPDGSDKYLDINDNIVARQERAIAEIARASGAYGELLYFQNDYVTGTAEEEYWDGYTNNPLVFLRNVTPQLTETDARHYADSLPTLMASDGSSYPAYRDEDNVVHLIGAPKGVTHSFVAALTAGGN